MRDVLSAPFGSGSSPQPSCPARCNINSIAHTKVTKCSDKNELVFRKKGNSVRIVRYRLKRQCTDKKSFLYVSFLHKPHRVGNQKEGRFKVPICGSHSESRGLHPAGALA